MDGVTDLQVVVPWRVKSSRFKRRRTELGNADVLSRATGGFANSPTSISHAV